MPHFFIFLSYWDMEKELNSWFINCSLWQADFYIKKPLITFAGIFILCLLLEVRSAEEGRVTVSLVAGPAWVLLLPAALSIISGSEQEVLKIKKRQYLGLSYICSLVCDNGELIVFFSGFLRRVLLLTIENWSSLKTEILHNLGWLSLGKLQKNCTQPWVCMICVLYMTWFVSLIHKLSSRIFRRFKYNLTASQYLAKLHTAPLSKKTSAVASNMEELHL